MQPSFRKLAIFPLIELLAFFLAPELDLQARWFGFLMGLMAGLGLWGIRRPAWRFVALSGYLAGTICDLLYLLVFGNTLHCFVALGWGVLAWFLVRRWGQWPFSWVRHSAALGVLILTLGLTFPNLLAEPRELPEGIYVYANDVVYNYPILNIVSSRAGIAVHTGICYVTKEPFRINRLRQEAGLSRLKFELLDRGYWINDLNLDVRDRDGFTNYASRTRLDDQSFPFDLEHMNHYLAGRSVNDRLKPAIRLEPLFTPESLEAWNRIVLFRDQMNALYRDGFIYSPIPYDGHFVRLYNCNTVTVGIADEFLNRGKEAERLTDMPLNFGRQGVTDGRRLMKDYRTDDFQGRIDRERAFWKSESPEKQRVLHRVLFVKPRDRR